MNAMLLNFIFAAAGVAGLYYGAGFLVKGGSAIARRAGVSQLVIGLTLVAFATSSPELVVSVSAALDGNADISIGNVVGSNICNIALILGLCACITPLAVHRQLIRFDAPVMLVSALMLTVFYLCSGGLDRMEGGIFLACLCIYTWFCIRMSRRECREEKAAEDSKSGSGNGNAGLPFALFLTAGGLVLLAGGAKLFLMGAVWFAGLLHLSDAVIGLTVVAIGTSLPELSTSVVAAAKGEKDIAVGNVLGSNIFNILGIMGITPLIRPLKDASLDPVDLGMMLFCSAVLLPILHTGWKISRREGAFLLTVYIGYTVYLILEHL